MLSNVVRTGAKLATHGHQPQVLKTLTLIRFIADHAPLASNKISSKMLTPEITFMTTHGSTLNLKEQTGPNLDGYHSEGRPLSILLTWLMAKPSAVMKYSQFYLDQGFDVLKVQITPWQLLMPTLVEPVVQNEILPILTSSDHSQKLIHGFSVGAYVFARMLDVMQQEPSEKYDYLMSSLKGQIWDSFTDVNGISIGVSKSLFMESPVLQQGLQRYVDFHMKAFHNVATKYYFMAHEGYYNKPLEAPALFFYSEVDQISTFDRNEAVQKEWMKRGINCTKKYWKDTGHVGHMKAHPEEYQMILKDFFKTAGINAKTKSETEGLGLMAKAGLIDKTAGLIDHPSGLIGANGLIKGAELVKDKGVGSLKVGFTQKQQSQNIVSQEFVAKKEKSTDKRI